MVSVKLAGKKRDNDLYMNFMYITIYVLKKLCFFLQTLILQTVVHYSAFSQGKFPVTILLENYRVTES